MLGDTPFHLVSHSLSSSPFVAVHRCPFNLFQRFVDRLDTTEGYPCERVGRSTRLKRLGNQWLHKGKNSVNCPQTKGTPSKGMRRTLFLLRPCPVLVSISVPSCVFAFSFTGIFYDELLSNTSTPVIISCFLPIADVTRWWIVQILGKGFYRVVKACLFLWIEIFVNRWKCERDTW